MEKANENCDDEDYNFNDYDDMNDEDPEEDEFETAMDECGKVPGGGCMLVGTEYCDWECPFHRIRNSKGRFSK